jgi:hypothetical protein
MQKNGVLSLLLVLDGLVGDLDLPVDPNLEHLDVVVHLVEEVPDDGDADEVGDADSSKGPDEVWVDEGGGDDQGESGRQRRHGQDDGKDETLQSQEESMVSCNTQTTRRT